MPGTRPRRRTMFRTTISSCAASTSANGSARRSARMPEPPRHAADSIPCSAARPSRRWTLAIPRRRFPERMGADPPWPKISRICPIAPCRCGRRGCIVSWMVRRRIAIIGSGFSGLCLGIQLKQAGIDSFTIFEKSDRLGGTWRDNTYPGAACDVPSFAYCFSFEQKTDWSRKWSPQEEIRDYMEHCARKYDVLRHIRFSTEIAGARFDEGESVWRLRTTNGEEITVDVLVSAVGQLSRPHIPDIPGLERFRGERFHSARWNHDVDLSRKRVAVIGNAASAIQFIPQIAPRVQRLTVFQRSPNWLLPRGDRAYSEREKRWFGRLPFLARLYRWWIWLQLEMRFPLFRGNRLIAAVVRRIAERNLRELVADARLREVLVPDYPIGGKRIVISDDYYQALGRENVELVTS